MCPTPPLSDGAGHCRIWTEPKKEIISKGETHEEETHGRLSFSLVENAVGAEEMQALFQPQ